VQIAQDWKHSVAGSGNGRHSALKRAFKEHTHGSQRAPVNLLIRGALQR
jgi:hypothetical protein